MKTELWDKIRNGDAEAMKILYQDCYQELYAFGFRLLPDKDQVKDCVHEIFCELWSNRSRIGQIDYIQAYLRTCVRNRILKEIKQEMNTERIGDQKEIFQLREHDYEQLLIASQQLEEQKLKIAHAINRLTAMQREIISLKFYEGLTYEAIAVQLNLKTRTVYNHVYSAICSLRENLKD